MAEASITAEGRKSSVQLEGSKLSGSTSTPWLAVATRTIALQTATNTKAVKLGIIKYLQSCAFCVAQLCSLQLAGQCDSQKTEMKQQAPPKN
eukprot:gnl/MRDRNA2_/MRDRNA2_130827_c0_seq1.p1 gnl/MRDRNA2_/MRDRNA2_130827_c0~~gnl/MRDRNA2_/MRDRNA2_130827_c0_seq1.p1  ORF type:complete len:105 (-),score=17.61 gnl/MRDRNA2_/MRDRNA2_130827_c0_seq1:34-309(-)